jgi:hypothetical protein
MEFMSLSKKDNGKMIANRIQIADTFWKRFRGLMLKPALEAGEGLLISPCSSIHMMFMKFPIDAIFIDAKIQVKALYRKLRPWLSISSIHRDACSVIELKAGTIDEVGLEIDDFLVLEKTK